MLLYRTRIVVLLAIGLALLSSTAASAPVPLFARANGLIAFVTTRDGTSEIYTMKADGSEQSRLTVNTAQDVSPTWSPDGSRIAFASNRDGDWEVYVMEPDGGNVERLTQQAGFDGAPSWSPDGTKIVFASARDGNSELYLMNADGSGQTRLTNNPADDGVPVWAPNSSACRSRADQIAFESNRSGNYDTYVIRADGTGLEAITSGPAGEFDPTWAPDCSSIAFDRVTDGEYDIYALNLATKVETRFTSTPSEDSRPAWSPDGRAIAFTTLRDGQYEVYTLNTADPTGQANLSDSYPSTDTQPAWQTIETAAPRPGQAAPALVFSVAQQEARPQGTTLTCGIGPGGGKSVLGTPSGDVMCSDDASQTLSGRAGDDRIIDRGGRDTIFGGRGRDVIDSRDGEPDVITGGPGVDEINADRFDVVRKATGDAVAP